MFLRIPFCIHVFGLGGSTLSKKRSKWSYFNVHTVHLFSPRSLPPGFSSVSDYIPSYKENLLSFRLVVALLMVPIVATFITVVWVALMLPRHKKSHCRTVMYIFAYKCKIISVTCTYFYM
jgi:hypothetical protein